MNNIDFQAIVTMLRIIPKKYKTDIVKVASGKYKLPLTVKQAIKKIRNG